MKKLNKLLIITGLIVNGLFLNKAFSITPEQLDSVIDVAGYQYKKMIIQVGDTTLYPRSSEKPAVSTADWTSGFFPGSMWYLYELTEDTFWRNNAARWTHAIEEQTDIDWTHDLGFMFYCSFGNGYRLVGTPAYESIMIDAANTLAGRYVATVGITDSWGWGSWDTKTEAIIDNMMNLELLYWATSATGDSSYYTKATNHAATTMANHFRSDYSSYHVVEYNPTTGAAISKHTHQGYADESSWARGQGWGLYGYTYVFRETGDSAFLDQADSIANYILNHPALPSDLVPYWDYDDPAIPGAPRDASAAALVSSALFELSQYSKQGELYYTKAVQILESLMSNSYLAARNANDYFILMHSTGHKPANSEIDEPLNYADYYFLEALTRYIKLSGINVSPSIEQLADLDVTPNKTTDVSISVSDANYGDTVTVKSIAMPDFASFTQVSNTKATLTLTPNSKNIGQQYPVTIVASDQDGASDTMTFNVTVEYNYKNNVEITASADDGNVPANTLDEDLNTRWSADGSGQWIMYDMHEDGGTLTSVSIAFYNGDARQSIFKLEVSNDTTKSWTQIFNGQSSGSTLDLENFYNDTIRARYIRYTGYGNTSNTWNSVTEVDFDYYPNNLPMGDSMVITETGFRQYLFEAKGFNDLDKDSFNYIWNFGDGSIDTTAYDTITHTYALDGKQVIELTAIDTFGGKYSLTDSIYINNTAPVGDSIQITQTGRTTYLLEAKGFTDADGHTLSYTWELGDGTIETTDTNSIGYTYAALGKYIITLTAEDGFGGEFSITDSVTIVNSAPVCDSIEIIEASRLAYEFEVKGLIEPDGDAVTYDWAFSDGGSITDGASSQSHTFSSLGKFYVTVTITDDFDEEFSITDSVTITNNAPTCDSIQITETSRLAYNFEVKGLVEPDGDAVTYDWAFSDGGSIANGASSQSHTFSSLGKFYVTVTITDDFDEEFNAIDSLTISNNPPVGDSIQITKTGRMTYDFEAKGISDPDGDDVSYSWNFGDGTTISAGNSTATHTYTTLGDYTVTLTVTDAFSEELSLVGSVKVSNKAPIGGSVSINESGDKSYQFTATGFSDPDGDNISYVWNFGDASADSTTQTTVNHTYANAGKYPVTLKVVDTYNGELLVYDTVTVNEVIDAIGSISVSELQIYPNPCNNELNIALGAKSWVDIKLRIADITGKVIQVQVKEVISGRLVIDVANLKKGIYLYSVITPDKTYTGKFIKQ